MGNFGVPPPSNWYQPFRAGLNPQAPVEDPQAMIDRRRMLGLDNEEARGAEGSGGVDPAGLDQAEARRMFQMEARRPSDLRGSTMSGAGMQITPITAAGPNPYIQALQNAQAFQMGPGVRPNFGAPAPAPTPALAPGMSAAGMGIASISPQMAYGAPSAPNPLEAEPSSYAAQAAQRLRPQRSRPGMGIGMRRGGGGGMGMGRGYGMGMGIRPGARAGMAGPIGPRGQALLAEVNGRFGGMNGMNGMGSGGMGGGMASNGMSSNGPSMDSPVATTSPRRSPYAQTSSF